MELIHVFLSCLIWFPLESQSQSCKEYQQPSIKVCTDKDVSLTNIIYIDAPDFKRTSCECVITPYMHTRTLYLELFSFTYSRGIKFEINNISIGTFNIEDRTKITDATTLLFSSLGNHHEKRGACFRIETENGQRFNISCTKATKAAKTQTATTSLFKESETFSISSEMYSISSTKVTREAKHHNSTASVSRAAVSLSVICAMLLVIIICLLVYIRRMRRRYENKQQSNEHHFTQQLSEIETRPEQVQVARSEATAAIASLNEYERLNMYISPNCNSEMYQQLNIANA